jgi:adenylate kinase
MEAIRKIVKVIDNTITIKLPENFSDGEVEVIVLNNDSIFALTENQKEILNSRISEPEDHYISSEQSIDYLKKKYGL